MGMVLPELIIETVLREGIQDLKNNLDTRINDIFSSLLEDHFLQKYGQAELDRIKELIQEKEIGIYQTLNFGSNDELVFAIEFLSGSESEPLVGGGFSGKEEESIPDADITLLSSVTPTAYESNSGILSITDASDLTNIYPNHIYVDASGEEFEIIGGIVNETGSKQITLNTDLTVDISAAGYIKSGVNYIQYSRQATHKKFQIAVHAFSKQPLRTTYLHAILKNIIYRDQKDLITRNFDNITLDEADFMREDSLGGDLVYRKTIVINGISEESWRAETDTIIERAKIDVKVSQDTATNSDIDREDQTVTIQED